MTGDDLFELVRAQLLLADDGKPATSAGDRVQTPGDMPSQQGDYPIIKLRLVGETKQSQGRGSIGYLTIVTIRVNGEVSAPADVEDPLTSDVEQRLWTLKREIERAIINRYPLFFHVQQLASVQTQLAFTAEATHLAGIQSDYAFEIYETAEDFAPLPLDVVTEIRAVDPNHPGIALATRLNP